MGSATNLGQPNNGGTTCNSQDCVCHKDAGTSEHSSGTPLSSNSPANPTTPRQSGRKRRKAHATKIFTDNGGTTCNSQDCVCHKDAGTSEHSSGTPLSSNSPANPTTPRQSGRKRRKAHATKIFTDRCWVRRSSGGFTRLPVPYIELRNASGHPCSAKSLARGREGWGPGWNAALVIRG